MIYISTCYDFLFKELQIQQQKERRLALEKTQQEPQCDEYTNWHERE